MLVKRFANAQPYEAPNHYDMRSLRLQGFESGGPTQSWVGLSHFLPGGGAGPDASPLEKVYVVSSGELTIRVGRRVGHSRPVGQLLHPRWRDPGGEESRQSSGYHDCRHALPEGQSMSELLRDPMRLFDVRGKVAVVTGASGAFGALASRVLAAAGARLILAAGNAARTRGHRAQCRELGAEVATVARRPNTESDCDAHHADRNGALWRA